MYVVQIKSGNDTICIPIKDADVSGREKAVATTSMQRVWKWVQDKNFGDKITLQDAYDLAIEMHGQSEDTGADAGGEQDGVREQAPPIVGQFHDEYLQPMSTPIPQPRVADNGGSDRGWELPSMAAQQDGEEEVFDNSDSAWGAGGGGGWSRPPKKTQVLKKAKGAKKARDVTNDGARGWNNTANGSDFGSIVMANANDNDVHVERLETASDIFDNFDDTRGNDGWGGGDPSSWGNSDLSCWDINGGGNNDGGWGGY
jgi:hypothetical protein